jgi:hypothetical protein
VLLVNLFYFSCKPKAKEEPVAEDKPFYPIGAFIKEQLNKLDSTPLAVF